MSFAIKDSSAAKSNTENDLKLMATWCFRNKLLINPEKTNLLWQSSGGNYYLISWKIYRTSSKGKKTSG
jgi:hypothetical protein